MNARLAILIVIVLLGLAMLSCGGINCNDPACWGGACAQCETGGL
jgi:hypothetical protein